jgi:hypothetical protein
VISFTRLKRRIKEYKDEKDEKYVNTNSIVVKFRCEKLPEEIKMYSVIRKVNNYIPKVKFCSNCLEFEHVNFDNRCRNEKVCYKCGEKHKYDPRECKIIKCKHCNQKHYTNNNKCEIYKIKLISIWIWHTTIKVMMKQKRISLSKIIITMF